MGSKAGATTAAFHIWASIACMKCSHARLPTRPAFLFKLPTTPQYHHRGDVSNTFRSQTRVNPFPLFSAAEKADTSQQTPESSEFDARGLEELLDDPGLMRSLQAQGRRSNGSQGSQESREESPKYGPLAAGNEVAPNGSDRSSVFESATMQVVEELQDSFRGLLAKVSAALESAGLYVSNRAQVDAKVVQATVNYVSREAAAGPRRLLLAATGAASPALLLMGVNITEAQTNLNDTLQLLSMGIVPDSMGLQPKLLPSLKDFDDDDKRLDAAYRRQRRRRPNPLPVKLLGALPSTINKAADLAYEVEQEVKYERAGSRANKLLKPLGLLLPEARGTNLLLGREPDGSGAKLLKAKAAQETSRSETAPPAEGRDGPAGERLCAGGEIVIEARKDSDVVSRGDGQKPLESGVFGMFKRFRRKIENSRVEERLTSAGSTLPFDQDMLATLAARPHFLTKYLTACKEATSDELKLQDRCLRAADALLCSTEAIIAGLDESARQDAIFLEGLREVEREVQQIYLLEEMAEAVEAAEAHLSRIVELSSNVVDLAVALEAYSTTANARMERLENIMARLHKVQRSGNIMYGQDPEDRGFVSDAVAILCSFDDEGMGPHREKNAVEEQVDVVRRDSAERVTGDASRAHEEAFIAACRLWDASARRSYREQPSTIGIRVELAKREQNEALVPGMEELEPWRNSNAQVGTETAAPDGSFPGIPSITEQQSKAREESWTQGETGKEAASARARRNSRFGDSPRRSPPGAVTPEPTRPNGAPIFAESGLPTRSTSQEAKRSDLSAEVEAVDATVLTVPVMRDATVVRGIFDRSDEDPVGRLDGAAVIATYELASEIVSETPSFVDTEAEVEDDLSDPIRLGLKFLDVLALLLEKVIFNGLPTIVSGGALVWERVDNALNGAKGRRGWRLLRRIETRVGGLYQDGSQDGDDK